MTESIPKKQVKCPSCRKPVSWKDNPHRPFCSERCATVDLGNWADNQYSFKGEQTDENSNNTSNESLA